MHTTRSQMKASSVLLANKSRSLIILIEAIAVAYIIYVQFGSYYVLGALVFVALAIFVGTWVISVKYETANMLKEPELYQEQNFIAGLKFGHFCNMAIFFPMRAFLVYFAYTTLEHGVILILLYLLYEQHNQQSLIMTNAIEANRALSNKKI